MQVEASIIDEVPPSDSTFEAKITYSLYRLYEQVESDTYEPNWKKRENGHAWLSYDGDSGLYIYDTRKRSDDWSDNLIDNILARNSSEQVEEWTKFLKTDEYKENMDTISSYYSSNGSYFRKIRTKYQSTGIVSSFEYDRITKNKYASKVIEAYRAEPKFALGSLVDFRTNHCETSDVDGMRRVYKRSANGILILSNTERVISACKGAKRYKAVCVGDTKPFYIEERYLKKKKKIKVNKK